MLLNMLCCRSPMTVKKSTTVVDWVEDENWARDSVVEDPQSQQTNPVHVNTSLSTTHAFGMTKSARSASSDSYRSGPSVDRVRSISTLQPRLEDMDEDELGAELDRVAQLSVCSSGPSVAISRIRKVGSPDSEVTLDL